MDQDIIVNIGSMLGRAIPAAMCLVALIGGWVMLFDALRLYRNRATRAGGEIRGRDLAGDLTLTAPGAARAGDSARVWHPAPRHADRVARTGHAISGLW
jgi:hypothetical protein